MSEVQRLRQQIEAAYMAGKQGLQGYAITARHDIIAARTARIDEYHEKLTKLVGEQAATEILIEVNDAIAPSQSRKDPMYCVQVNEEVLYFGPNKALAEQTWIVSTTDPTKRVVVSVDGVVQAVREAEPRPGRAAQNVIE